MKLLTEVWFGAQQTVVDEAIDEMNGVGDGGLGFCPYKRAIF